MEKVVVAKSKTVDSNKTMICCTRYGNVLLSRGSVIPLWINQINENKPMTITDRNMTRFIMSLEEAVQLVEFAFENAKSGDILVQKSPSCTIEVLANAVKDIFNSNCEIKQIGIRHGEKLYETLLTNEEYYNSIDMGYFYRVPCDKRELNYDEYFEIGDLKRNLEISYNSSNTVLLDINQVKDKLLSLDDIKKEIESFIK
jgi:UDP-glucose 4-epimerase